MGHNFYGDARERAAHIRNIQKEHRQILAAIRTGDADKAETLATSHSLLARKRATDFLSLSLAGEVALKEPGHLRTAGKKKQRSGEHTSGLPSLLRISYAVLCLKKNTTDHNKLHIHLH